MLLFLLVIRMTHPELSQHFGLLVIGDNGALLRSLRLLVYLGVKNKNRTQKFLFFLIKPTTGAPERSLHTTNN